MGVSPEEQIAALKRGVAEIISDLIPDTEVIALSWPLYDSEAPSRGTLIGLLLGYGLALGMMAIMVPRGPSSRSRSFKV